MLQVSCVYSSSSERDTILIKTMIRGSTKSPDLVLNKVLELEKEGLIFNLVILESFPLQIHFEAKKSIVNEVNAIKQAK